MLSVVLDESVAVAVAFVVVVVAGAFDVVGTLRTHDLSVPTGIIALMMIHEYFDGRIIMMVMVMMEVMIIRTMIRIMIRMINMKGDDNDCNKKKES
jgi:hypothetical protein